MNIPGAEERQRELEAIDKKYPHIYRIIAGIVLVGIAAVVGAAMVTDRDGYITNLFTELLSIGITIFVLDTLAAIRADNQLKAQLIREMGSRDNGIASRSANELRAQGWLTDGSVNSADLSLADLSGVDLRRSDLSGVRLVETNLSNAHLQFANLSRADLALATLKEANFGGANLTSANLFFVDMSKRELLVTNLNSANLYMVNLYGATLVGVDLCGANLSGANLCNVTFNNVQFSGNTVLPDETHWTPDTDMARFTDSNYSKFWRSDDPYSPAYRGR